MKSTLRYAITVPYRKGNDIEGRTLSVLGVKRKNLSTVVLPFLLLKPPEINFPLILTPNFD